MSSEISSDLIPKLNPSNFHTWYAEIADLLHEKGYWGIVNGTVSLSTEKAHKMVLAKEKALGLIRRSVELALKGTIAELDDPKAILDKLKVTYGVSNAGTQFNALKSFLSLTQQPDKHISTFISWGLRCSVHFCQCQAGQIWGFNLWFWTVHLCLNQWHSCLFHPHWDTPDETYPHSQQCWSSIGNCWRNLLKINIIHCTPCLVTSPCHPCAILIQIWSWVRPLWNKRLPQHQGLPEVEALQEPAEYTANAWAARESQDIGGNSQTESAGNASALSMPMSSASDYWITDTGATLHMTPNREWLKDYKACKVPVCLADNNVIYAAVLGSVVFTPVKNGMSLCQIEFTNILLLVSAHASREQWSYSSVVRAYPATG